MAKFKKGHAPWNKGMKSDRLKCSKCGMFIPNSKKHTCASVDLKGQRFCRYCGRALDNKINSERWGDFCTQCSGKRATIWEKLMRTKLIAAFGGKCQICSFDEAECALDFHHLDEKKASEQHYSLGAIKKQPEKFVLVCSNHHRMITKGILNSPAAIFKKDFVLSVSVSNKERDEILFAGRR